jgi:hypothetical protein
MDDTEENDVIETWKFFLVEIALSFGKGDREDKQEKTLKRIIDFKTNKYAPLIRSLKTQLSKSRRKKRFEVEFLPFVIWSFGAIPNQSITNLMKMIGAVTKNTIGL